MPLARAQFAGFDGSGRHQEICEESVSQTNDDT